MASPCRADSVSRRILRPAWSPMAGRTPCIARVRRAVPRAIVLWVCARHGAPPKVIWNRPTVDQRQVVERAAAGSAMDTGRRGRDQRPYGPTQQTELRSTGPPPCPRDASAGQFPSTPGTGLVHQSEAAVRSCSATSTQYRDPDPGCCAFVTIVPGGGRLRYAHGHRREQNTGFNGAGHPRRRTRLRTRSADCRGSVRPWTRLEVAIACACTRP